MSIEKPKDNIEWAMKILIEKLQNLEQKYGGHGNLFDKYTLVPNYYLKIVHDDIPYFCRGSYPELNVKIETASKLFKCWSTETDSKYTVTVESEYNKTDGKPRRKGTKTKQIFTFEKEKRSCKEKTFINMEGEEELVLSYNETITPLNEDIIEYEWTRVQNSETKTEFTKEQKDLIQQVFGATQKPENLGVLATALREDLAYKHVKEIGPNGDLVAEESMWKDNIIFIDYLHNPKPGYHNDEKDYKIIILVNSEGTKITASNNKGSISFSSYEEFIQQLDFEIANAKNGHDNAKYLEDLKSIAKKLQELGINIKESKKEKSHQYILTK